MPTAFPGGVDAFTIPTTPASTALGSAGGASGSHSALHDDINDAITSIETAVLAASGRVTYKKIIDFDDPDLETGMVIVDLEVGQFIYPPQMSLRTFFDDGAGGIGDAKVWFDPPLTPIGVDPFMFAIEADITTDDAGGDLFVPGAAGALTRIPQNSVNYTAFSGEVRVAGPLTCRVLDSIGAPLVGLTQGQVVLYIDIATPTVV